MMANWRRLQDERDKLRKLIEMEESGGAKITNLEIAKLLSVLMGETVDAIRNTPAQHVHGHCRY